MKKIKKIEKKKKNFKKIFLSSLAMFSLVSVATVSSWNSNSNLSISDASKIVKDASTTTNSFLPPEANDLYDDYSYANGFVTINGSVISFYDWFGFNLWSFDANANLGNIFGNSSLKISTLKVKSSADGSQIFVYGYFTNNSSYLFRLNATNGLIAPIAGVNAFTSGLILNANLLTIVDGYAVLTQKTPYTQNSSQNISINISQVNLQTGELTNNSYDITSTKSSNYITEFGEIIFVQKVGTSYFFGIKVITYNSSNSSQYRPAEITIYINNNSYSSSIMCNFFNWMTSSSTNINLDNINYCVENVTTTSGQNTYLAPKYDSTTLSGLTFNGGSYIGAGIVATYNLTSTNFTATNITNKENNGSQSNNTQIAGITDFLYDQANSKLYAVFANNTSQSLFAISPLDDNPLNWINLSTSGISTSTNQIFDINFIPNTYVDNSSINSSNSSYLYPGYSGYLEIQKQNDPNVAAINSETKTFFSLNSSDGGSTWTLLTPINNLNFSFAVSDTDIKNKYKPGTYKATQETKNELISDLIKINQNGNPYNNVSYTDGININTATQSLEGSVTLSIGNWWNLGKSEITRNISINLNTADVIVYAAIIVAVLVIIAIILIICRAFQEKGIKKFKEKIVEEISDEI